MHFVISLWFFNLIVSVPDHCLLFYFPPSPAASHRLLPPPTASNLLLLISSPAPSPHHFPSSSHLLILILLLLPTPLSRPSSSYLLLLLIVSPLYPHCLLAVSPLFPRNSAFGSWTMSGSICFGIGLGVCQIAYNIIKSRIKLNSTEKALLKRERCLLYIMGDRTLGYQQKNEALRGKQRFVHILLKIADLFGPLATIMEKMVIVPYDKYQRMLEANWRCQCNKVPKSIFHNFKKNAKNVNKYETQKGWFLPHKWTEYVEKHWFQVMLRISH